MNAESSERALTQILFEMVHQFLKNNAVLEALRSSSGSVWAPRGPASLSGPSSVTGTYGVHPLAVEGHHGVGRVAH